MTNILSGTSRICHIFLFKFNILLFSGMTICICNAAVSSKLTLLGKNAQQSSTSTTYAAGKAIDGKTFSDTGQDGCSLTQNDANAWWRIYLEKVYVVEAVKIYNRVGNHRRLQKLNIAVGYDPEVGQHSLCKYYDKTIPSGGSDIIHCNRPLLGTYVSIQRTTSRTYNEDGTSTDNDGYLSLCEVEIWGYEGKITLKPANANQSSGAAPYGPEKAVDGLTEATGDVYSCTHTAEEAKPWWRIRLDKLYAVHAVKIYNKQYTYRRLRELNVTVGTTAILEKQSLCDFYNDTVPSSGSAIIKCIDLRKSSSYITIQKTTRAELMDVDGRKLSDTGGFLSLCEVEVYGYEAVACGAPPTITSATWTGSDYSYWSTVKYSCDAGYKVLSGDMERRCAANRAWTGINIACQKVVCSTPPPIANAKMTGSNYLYGGVVTYTCNPGHGAGSRTIQCGADGQWSKNILQCQEGSCSTPPEIANARMTGSDIMPGAVVTYTCNTGYGLASGTIRCGNDEKWTTTNLKCYKVNCGMPPSISNAKWTGTTWTYGSTVKYSCNTGYNVTSGDRNRLCGADSRWNGTDIKCDSTEGVTSRRPSGLNLPLWAGLAVAALVLIAIICLTVFCLVRRHGEQSGKNKETTAGAGNPVYDEVTQPKATQNGAGTDFEHYIGTINVD